MKNVAEQLRDQSECIDAMQRRLDAVCEEIKELKKWVGMPEYDGYQGMSEEDDEDESEDCESTDLYWVVYCMNEDGLMHYVREVELDGFKAKNSAYHYKKFWSTNLDDALKFDHRETAMDFLDQRERVSKYTPPDVDTHGGVMSCLVKERK